jgi:hypothetical protein
MKWVAKRRGRMGHIPSIISQHKSERIAGTARGIEPAFPGAGNPAAVAIAAYRVAHDLSSPTRLLGFPLRVDRRGCQQIHEIVGHRLSDASLAAIMMVIARSSASSSPLTTHAAGFWRWIAAATASTERPLRG